MRGADIAERPDVADGPEVAEFTGCGRAVEIPVAGSALFVGHSPLVGFFLAAQLTASFVATLGPLVCNGVAVAVDAIDDAELVDARDDEEFCRVAVLRGPGVNILLTSSGFIAAKPLPLDVHPIRVLGWKFRGGATAVI